MNTSIIGYPRVGTLRELKFATEKYFRKEISADELQKTAVLAAGEISHPQTNQNDQLGTG